MATIEKRLAALEQARWERLSPLERAYERIERGTPLERWASAELEAYGAAEFPEMALLTTSELEALAAAPEDRSEAMYARFLEGHRYVKPV
jgi:hypothetical protein